MFIIIIFGFTILLCIAVPYHIPIIVLAGGVCMLISVRGANPTPRELMDDKGVPQINKKNRPL